MATAGELKKERRKEAWGVRSGLGTLHLGNTDPFAPNGVRLFGFLYPSFSSTVDTRRSYQKSGIPLANVKRNLILLSYNSFTTPLL